ncbi:MAG: methyl-accepting chemotaxis protein [Thiotrichaceae bacterium]|nr:methyl-accepting chemotaxis protein [Thiotrichaceae bacterium]
MKLTRTQLEQLYTHMQDLGSYTLDQESATKKNIVGTNRVIYIFTLLGFVIMVFAFYTFYQLSGAINHSIKSMETMEKQVVIFRKSVGNVSETITEMGGDVEQILYMSNSISQIADRTKTIDLYLGKISVQIQHLSKDSVSLNQSSAQMESSINKLNQSTGRIAYSLHETAKPIKQFIPIP